MSVREVVCVLGQNSAGKSFIKARAEKANLDIELFDKRKVAAKIVEVDDVNRLDPAYAGLLDGRHRKALVRVDEKTQGVPELRHCHSRTVVAGPMSVPFNFRSRIAHDT